MAQLPSSPATPECDKFAAARPKLDVIIEFLEWLQEGNAGKPEQRIGPVILGFYPFVTEKKIYDRDLNFKGYEDIPEDEQERGDNLASLFLSNEKLVRQFFDIDENVLDKERRALLQYQRDLNDA